MATPYVSARGRNDSADHTPRKRVGADNYATHKHAKIAVQNLMASQTFAGVTLISPQWVVGAGRNDPPPGELKELLKKKQEGKPIERPERPKPTNVVNLMEALRRSVEAGDAPTSAKAAGAPQRRRTSDKAEHPRKKARRAS